MAAGTIGFVLMTVVWAFEFGSYTAVKNIFAGVLIYTVSVVLIYVMLRIFSKSGLVFKQRKLTPLFILSHFLIAFSAVVAPLLYLWIFNKINNSVGETVSNALNYNTSPILAFILNHIGILCISMPIVISMISVLCYFHCGKQWFTVISHAFGSIIGNALPLIPFNSLTEEIKYTYNFNILIVYAVSVVATLLFSRIIATKSHSGEVS